MPIRRHGGSLASKVFCGAMLRRLPHVVAFWLRVHIENNDVVTGGGRGGR
jgi:hypothetical protein